MKRKRSTGTNLVCSLLSVLLIVGQMSAPLSTVHANELHTDEAASDEPAIEITAAGTEAGTGNDVIDPSEYLIQII